MSFVIIAIPFELNGFISRRAARHMDFALELSRTLASARFLSADRSARLKSQTQFVKSKGFAPLLRLRSNHKVVGRSDGRCGNLIQRDEE